MASRSRSKTRVGTRLKPEDKEYVVNTMAHPGETERQFLATHRFAVTKYGRLDRRTRAPAYRATHVVSPINLARAETMRMRAIVRMVLDEIKDE